MHVYGNYCSFVDVSFFLNGKLYPNNYLVNLEEIGEANKALVCLTNRIECCTNGSQGDWYNPEDMIMPITTTKDDSTNFYTSRGPSHIRLNKNNVNNSIFGIYYCEIPDSSGTDQRIYIGIYGNEQGGISYDFQPILLYYLLLVDRSSYLCELDFQQSNINLYLNWWPCYQYHLEEERDQFGDRWNKLSSESDSHQHSEC
jgi:hypothetical protein